MNIVITGASGGIGQVLAKSLKADQMVLFYNTNMEDISKLASSLRLPVETRRCDLTSEDEVKAAFEDIKQIDVLINSAGVVDNALVESMTEKQWDTVLDTNLKGVFLGSKYAIPRMNPGSHIVNISSILSGTGIVGACNYAASKGGLESFTKSLARELIKRGIFVNCISLGFFETGLGKKLSEKAREHALQQIPTHEFGNPIEIVRAVEYIIGSKYLIGTIINLSGGYYL
jgi:3-oxoacyl-[acyl-carrier protein] reductase